MAYPDSSIFRRLGQLQIHTAQCDRELRDIRSPRCEHEERLSIVNARLDETWQALYSSQTGIDRSELQTKIVDYGRELEKLQISHQAGLKDAESSYKYQIEAVWERFCARFVTVLGPTRVQKTLQSLSGKSERHCYPHGSIENPQNDSISAEQSQSILHRADFELEITGNDSHAKSVSTPYSTGKSLILTDQV